jgi:hypothetical protein
MVKKSASEIELYRQQHQAEISAAYAALSATPQAPRSVLWRQRAAIHAMKKKYATVDTTAVDEARRVLREAGLW